MSKIVVHESRVLAWMNRIILPAGVLALLLSLIQSLGISVPGGSIFWAPPEWGSRLFLLVILFVWIRAGLNVFNRMRDGGVVLIVDADGVHLPKLGGLGWNELDTVSHSFGWTKFYSESHPQNGFKIWGMGINQREWQTAKREIDRRLNAKT